MVLRLGRKHWSDTTYTQFKYLKPPSFLACIFVCFNWKRMLNLKLFIKLLLEKNVIFLLYWFAVS